MGWTTFSERYMKVCLRYKVRLEQMDNTRWARKVYVWNMWESKWNNKCKKMVHSCGLDGWRGMLRAREDGNVKRSKVELENIVKQLGLRKWKSGMESKKSLEWYKEKETPKVWKFL